MPHRILPALLNGDPCSQFAPPPTVATPDVFAFARHKGAAGIVVVVSVADQARKMTLAPLPEKNYRELFTGKMQRLREGTIVNLPPHRYLAHERLAEKQYPIRRIIYSNNQLFNIIVYLLYRFCTTIIQLLPLQATQKLLLSRSWQSFTQTNFCSYEKAPCFRRIAPRGHLFGQCADQHHHDQANHHHADFHDSRGDTRSSLDDDYRVDHDYR